MTSPFLRRLEKERIGDVGRKSEKRVAKSLGARLTPASGAMRGAKGDMAKGQFLIEAKSTVNNSMALELSWLVKVAHEAGATGKIPVLILSYVDSSGRPRTKTNAEYVLMPKVFFDELIEK